MTGGAQSHDPSIHASLAAEVERLHQVFEDWFCGRGGRRIEEFSASLAPEFVIVAPSGEVFDRQGIIALVDDARAARTVEIEIVAPSLQHVGAVVVGTYEEHQRSAEGGTRRISTVVMRSDEDAPGGWSWLAVHETWLPPDLGT